MFSKAFRAANPIILIHITSTLMPISFAIEMRYALTIDFIQPAKFKSKSSQNEIHNANIDCTALSAALNPHKMRVCEFQN